MCGREGQRQIEIETEARRDQTELFERLCTPVVTVEQQVAQTQRQVADVAAGSDGDVGNAE